MLNPAQQNYPAHVIGLLAGVATHLETKLCYADDLQRVQYFQFQWLTDHRGLPYLLNQQKLVRRQAGTRLPALAGMEARVVARQLEGTWVRCLIEKAVNRTESSCEFAARMKDCFVHLGPTALAERREGGSTAMRAPNTGNPDAIMQSEVPDLLSYLSRADAPGTGNPKHHTLSLPFRLSFPTFTPKRNATSHISGKAGLGLIFWLLFVFGSRSGWPLLDLNMGVGAYI